MIHTGTLHKAMIHTDNQLHLYRLSAQNIPQVDHNVHVGSPSTELALPGSKCGEWHNQEERPIQLVLMKQVGKE